MLAIAEQRNPQKGSRQGSRSLLPAATPFFCGFRRLLLPPQVKGWGSGKSQVIGCKVISSCRQVVLFLPFSLFLAVPVLHPIDQMDRQPVILLDATA